MTIENHSDFVWATPFHIADGGSALILFNRLKKRKDFIWRVPAEIRLAIGEGRVVVHRKHKRRQQDVGPQTARIDEIFAIMDGELEILMGRKWWPAPAHTFACIPRGLYYAIRQKPSYKGPAHIVNLLFKAPEGWAAGLAHAPIKLPAPWWRRFMDLEGSCDFDAAGQRVAPLAEVLAFVERLARAAAQQPALSEGPRRPDTGAEWMETWAQAEDTIRARAASGLSVEELAEAVNVSPTQLRRVYLSARGISPKAALTQWRIEEARKLLASGKWNATQVAEKTGFSTLQRFSAVFKSVTGENPSAFARKQ